MFKGRAHRRTRTPVEATSYELAPIDEINNSDVHLGKWYMDTIAHIAESERLSAQDKSGAAADTFNRLCSAEVVDPGSLVTGMLFTASRLDHTTVDDFSQVIVATVNGLGSKTPTEALVAIASGNTSAEGRLGELCRSVLDTIESSSETGEVENAPTVTKTSVKDTHDLTTADIPKAYPDSSPVISDTRSFMNIGKVAAAASLVGIVFTNPTVASATENDSSNTAPVSPETNNLQITDMPLDTIDLNILGLIDLGTRPEEPEGRIEIPDELMPILDGDHEQAPPADPAPPIAPTPAPPSAPSPEDKVIVEDEKGEWNSEAMVSGVALKERLMEKYEQVSGKLEAGELEKIGDQWGSFRLEKHAAEAFRALNEAFKAEFGENLGFSSDPYRSYESQYDNKYNKKYSAAHRAKFTTPGKSNHGWGLAGDFINNINDYTSKEHKWMVANAARFGFILPDWAQASGSKPEPWHWEWAGIDALQGSAAPAPDAKAEPSPVEFPDYESGPNSAKIKEIIGSFTNLEPSQKDFLEDLVLSIANIAGADAEVNLPAMTAQAIKESGWGRSNLTKKGNALFGIKANDDWDGATINAETFEYYDSKTRTDISDDFRAYENPVDSLKDYISFITSKEHYQDALLFSDDARMYLTGLVNKLDANGKVVIRQGEEGSMPYATDPEYVEKTMEIVDKYRLQELLALAGSPAGSADRNTETPPPEVNEAPRAKEMLIDHPDAEVAVATAMYFAENNGSITKYCSGRENCVDYCGRASAVVWGYETAGHNSAKEMWQYALDENLAKINSDMPVGAVMFYEGNPQNGHVAIYVGQGKIATNINKNGKDEYTYMSLEDARKTYKKFLGWTSSEVFRSNRRQNFGSVPERYIERVRSMTKAEEAQTPPPAAPAPTPAPVPAVPTPEPEPSPGPSPEAPEESEEPPKDDDIISLDEIIEELGEDLESILPPQEGGNGDVEPIPLPKEKIDISGLFILDSESKPTSSQLSPDDTIENGIDEFDIDKELQRMMDEDREAEIALASLDS